MIDLRQDRFLNGFDQQNKINRTFSREAEKLFL